MNIKLQDFKRVFVAHQNRVITALRRNSRRRRLTLTEEKEKRRTSISVEKRDIEPSQQLLQKQKVN